MNYYNDNHKKDRSGEMDEGHIYRLIDEYAHVFIEQEGVARVLGEDHPVPRLMKHAEETLDPEELAVAHAAYEALPEEVLHRVHHPWVGHPPPPGTRQRLREELAPKLVGESIGEEPVGCYLQLDARKGSEEEVNVAVDKDGHMVDSAIVYDPRTAGCPLRVQVAEGSDKEKILELLRKVSETLERDWDELTDAERHLRLPEVPIYL